MLKFTLEWLKIHINFYENDVIKLIKDIENVINTKSMEIEDVKFINPLITVDIHKCERREGLKVSICQTKLNEELKPYIGFEYHDEIQVLCGADNARSGITTVLAPIGTNINGITINPRKIKDVESFGMFCSPVEAGIQGDALGILEINEKPGKIFKIEDVFFKISCPTNRWDLMSVRGIARELACAGLGDFKPLECKIGKNDFDINISTDIDVSLSFIKVKNIKINEKIRVLMDRIGESQKSDLKYLNDFVLLDIGHPVHIYDAANVQKINLRWAKKDEKFTTLKNNEFITKGTEVMIEINDSPACIGGIIGVTGFNNETKDVIIEAGYFFSKNITCLKTDASKLFEAGVDFNQETIGYVGSLVDGDHSKAIMTKGQAHGKKSLVLNYSQFYRTTEIAISIEEICKNLKKYGFVAEIDRRKRDDSINDEFVIVCDIPSWRTDINIPEDLIEEIVRIIDFTKYLKDFNIFQVNKSLNFIDFYDVLRNRLINYGFIEMYNPPFVSSGDIKINNALNIDKSYLRNNLIESLSENCFKTLSYGSSNCMLFEIGKIYPSEEIKLGLAIKGEETRNWKKINYTYDFYFLKRIIDEFSDILDIDISNCKKSNDNIFEYGLDFHNGKIGKIKTDSLILNNVFIAEISIKESIKSKKSKKIETQKKIYEDLSITLSKEIGFEHINNIIDIEYYIFDYFEKEDGINYGITLIFNEGENSKEKLQDIKKKIQLLNNA